jgi:hypothetical protein
MKHPKERRMHPTRLTRLLLLTLLCLTPVVRAAAEPAITPTQPPAKLPASITSAPPS